MDCSCAVDLSTFAHLFVADSANTSYQWRLNGDDDSESKDDNDDNQNDDEKNDDDSLTPP